MPPPVNVFPSFHATGGYDGWPVSTKLEQLAGFGVADAVEEHPPAHNATVAERPRAIGSFTAFGFGAVRAAAWTLVRARLL